CFRSWPALWRFCEVDPTVQGTVPNRQQQRAGPALTLVGDASWPNRGQTTPGRITGAGDCQPNAQPPDEVDSPRKYSEAPPPHWDWLIADKSFPECLP